MRTPPLFTVSHPCRPNAVGPRNDVEPTLKVPLDLARVPGRRRLDHGVAKRAPSVSGRPRIFWASRNLSLRQRCKRNGFLPPAMRVRGCPLRSDEFAPFPPAVETDEGAARRQSLANGLWPLQRSGEARGNERWDATTKYDAWPTLSGSGKAGPRDARSTIGREPRRRGSPNTGPHRNPRRQRNRRDSRSLLRPGRKLVAAQLVGLGESSPRPGEPGSKRAGFVPPGGRSALGSGKL